MIVTSRYVKNITATTQKAHVQSKDHLGQDKPASLAAIGQCKTNSQHHEGTCIDCPVPRDKIITNLDVSEEALCHIWCSD